MARTRPRADDIPSHRLFSVDGIPATGLWAARTNGYNALQISQTLRMRLGSVRKAVNAGSLAWRRAGNAEHLRKASAP